MSTLELTRTTWEYRVIEAGGRKPSKLEKELNELGRDGWELVSLTSPQKSQMGPFSTSTLVAYLKRAV